jgi:hypothetical protein
MNSNALKLLVLLMVSLSMYSCKKRRQVKPQLPAITQEGKNTFGYMFGNEFWLPANSITLAYPNLSARYTPESGLMIECRRQNPNSRELPRDYMFIAFNKPDLKPGEYELNDTNTRLTIGITTASNTHKEYALNNTGNLTITSIDLVNNIASGTFSFQLKETTTGEIVNVTQGRFDLKIKRY